MQNIPIKPTIRINSGAGGGESLAKLALTRALLGRMPGMHQPGMAPIKPVRVGTLNKPSI